MNIASSEQFSELTFYTLSHPDKDYFIHQHVVDAFHAQTANQHTKPIQLTFALVGLYLFLEKDYSGRQVQEAHAKIASEKISWPQQPLPIERGVVTAGDVLNAAAGSERDEIIKQWCASVWHAYAEWHVSIEQLVKLKLDEI
ncbi:MAG: DUF5946 family protein [Bacteroidota bacterium]